MTSPARVTHAVHLLPQDTTLAELDRITTLLHPQRTTFTYSADAAHAIAHHGDDKSSVIVWGRERWHDDILAWIHDRGVPTAARNMDGSLVLGHVSEPAPSKATPARIMHTIHLLPQQTTQFELKQITEQLHPNRTAFTHSADAVHALIFSGNRDSAVVVWAGERWTDDIFAWLREREIDNIDVRQFEPAPTIPPFRLRWPTEFDGVNQPFLARPEVYGKIKYTGLDGRVYFLPGHEGIDLAAPLGSKVFACADGQVSRVSLDGDTDPERFPYGNQVRIVHTGGFETIYAHLQTARIDERDTVRAGDLIGLAGSTGNSEGPHLHLTLKKRGATAAGETVFKNDVVDPSPYLLPFDGIPITRLEVGMHNLEGAQWMLDHHIGGWAVQLAELGTQSQAIDATRFEEKGIKVLVRLNYHYTPRGNIPRENHPDYEPFITACVQTMLNSKGVWGFIFGNETNNPNEFPDGEPITPERYALVYNRIWHQVPKQIRMGVQAVDPYFGPGSDCRDYWVRMLDKIEGTDFLTVHPKTQDSNPDNVDSDAKFGDHPLQWQYLHLRSYEPLLFAVPSKFRNLPVIATEVNPQRHNDGHTLGWQTDQGAEWVRRAVAHFNAYNARASLPISGIVFYRYSVDKWKFDDKPAILDAIKAAAV